MDKILHLKPKLLAENNNYYNNIFKRTENLTKAVLYIVSEIKETEKTKQFISKLRDKIFKTHETVLATLQIQEHEQSDKLKALRQELVELSSFISLAPALQIITQQIVELLLEQIDAVVRQLNNHWLNVVINEDVLSVKTNNNIFNYRSTDDSVSAGSRTNIFSDKPKTKSARVKIPEGDISSDAYLVYSQLSDRSERIKTILATKPQATIKDIAEVITDISEKTIQRELNNLIKKGQVIREGERRWSRYSLRT